ncbi:flagellar basal body-associated FliL family protein [Citrobacter farmeri]|uniref:flagellar basal body-associated FliL family protein n=1 Tax=Citrobacter farmeri TaxID=67824 RepID=UPI0018A0223D|nr:flagellar basal body-associated FliL family protein [Citrobacter farmeri]EHK0945816.1 flagellar basal body-associated FliL family protein [Citrobacter farmeri]EKU0082261.1 flagellar basal body-associated FliL family protein [Citrobacter farmeri]EKU0082812.1 flagellar basal body-associated FliL family protein [Citrobacter farmeri]EKX4541406.1 flagellar basal body-associated FliL family protein [Citrobacter farmeri]MBJ9165117.1 flagellar basal body-associated FliL family protein [Citrobacter 
MKRIVIASVLSSVIAIVAGGVAGWSVYHYLGNGKPASTGHAAEETLDENNSTFVSLQETIVTLHDGDGSDHYMSAEMVMVVMSEKESEKVKQQEPLYQSIAVERLSEMKYEDIREMNISGIRLLIADALKKELQTRKITAPYKDILVKKVVFQ